MGGARAAGPVHDHRARGGDRGARSRGFSAGCATWARRCCRAIRYRPVEVEPARLAALEARLAEAGFGDVPLLEEADADASETGAVVANEVLDALPVHRVVGRPDRPDGIAELLVGLDAAGAFAWTEGDPTTPDLAARLRAEDVALVDGQVTEVCLALDGWLAGATRHLGRGVVVLVDYADEPRRAPPRGQPPDGDAARLRPPRGRR